MVDAAPRAPLHALSDETVTGGTSFDRRRPPTGLTDAPAPRPATDPQHGSAKEELRVAAEVLAEAAAALMEARAHVREADEAQDVTRTTMSTVAAAVPLAVLTTDHLGTIAEANPAAGHLLGTPFPRLRGKPLPVFVALEERRLMRRLVSEAARRGGARGRMRLVPRSGEAVDVDAVAVKLDGTLQWVLVPAGDAAPAPADAPPAGAAAPAPTEQTAPTAREDAPDAMRAIAELCRLEVGSSGVRDVLDRAAVLVSQAVPGADHASVSLGDPLAPTQTASSSAKAQRLDGLQLAAGHGPSMTAWEEALSCSARSDGVGSSEVALGAGEHPASAVDGHVAVAVPAFSGTEPVGVLTVYGHDAEALGTDVARDRIAVFASAVAALVDHARHVEDLRLTAEQLESAMASRAGIEQAKGMVAAWLGCSVEEAFALLSRLSQDRNVKLREVAGFVVADPENARTLVRSRASRSRRADGA